MIAAFGRLLDRWRGGGQFAVTVPPMDGVLSPNQAIEEAPVVLSLAAPDNLVADGGAILFSSGGAVHRLDLKGGAAASDEIARWERPVSALALGPGGALAAGLDGRGIAVRGGRHDGRTLTSVGGRPVVAPTALSFLDADTLLVALGSQQNAAAHWRRDLMQKNATGSVWRCDLPTGKAACLADRLAWPAGLLPGADGSVVVSESWRSRLVRVAAGETPAEILADVTGYPGRLAPARDGGAWLSVFAPRSQLVEFVLREDDYRASMMRELDEAHWIAPTLEPAHSFLEPMQFGGLKQLGVLKPWAPTRSYGLVIGLDADGEPRSSFHSRADGRRHGTTSAVEVGGTLLAASRGGDAIIAIPLPAE